jgi:hypothetical protein
MASTLASIYLQDAVRTIGKLVLLLLAGHLLARGRNDFQGPDNPEGIIGVQPGGGLRVQMTKALV